MNELLFPNEHNGKDDEKEQTNHDIIYQSTNENDWEIYIIAEMQKTKIWKLNGTR